tara:strand:+ start:62 stop:340 length:279 start_codon:yes stop_codon:yes gene_type:complete
VVLLKLPFVRVKPEIDLGPTAVQLVVAALSKSMVVAWAESDENKPTALNKVTDLTKFDTLIIISTYFIVSLAEHLQTQLLFKNPQEGLIELF